MNWVGGRRMRSSGLAQWPVLDLCKLVDKLQGFHRKRGISVEMFKAER